MGQVLQTGPCRSQGLRAIQPLSFVSVQRREQGSAEMPALCHHSGTHGSSNLGPCYCLEGCFSAECVQPNHLEGSLVPKLLGPIASCGFSRSWVGPKNLHFKQVSR